MCFNISESEIHSCNGLNAYVSPKFVCWNLVLKVMILEGGAFGRCLGYEPPWRRLVCSWKRPHRSPSPFAVRLQLEGTVCKPESRPSPYTDCQHLDLGLWTLEGYTPVVYKPSSRWYFVIAAKQTKTILQSTYKYAPYFNWQCFVLCSIS